MNKTHLQQIFNNYIANFDSITYGHEEIYKWEIINNFRRVMDEALASPDEEFPSKLNEAKKLSENLIDSYTTPFYGLVKFAEKEPETVRQMFLSLYSDDNGDLLLRQKKIQDFLKQSHALRDKYYPDSFMYKDYMHSVTGYLFLYDSDHNYMYKASQSLAFADCVEFYDDWGYGDSLKLDVYYKMCDQLVEEIKASEQIMSVDASRFTDDPRKEPKPLYQDREKHILAFDIIYGCSVYGLFDGISFDRPKSKKRQIIKERKEKAIEVSNKLKAAEARYDLMLEAVAYVESVYVPGTEIQHRTMGKGTILEKSGSTLVVEFQKAGVKKLGLNVSVAGKIISVDTCNYAEKIELYKDLLKNEKAIRDAYARAEKEMDQYADYLD